MKQLLKNLDTNVIEMLFEGPVNASAEIELISIEDELYHPDMLGSIWTDINNYKPYPSTSGGYWESDGKNWFDARSNEVVWEDVRKERDKELLRSDWTQLNDSPLQFRWQWTVYRQKLRQIPNDNLTDPHAAEAALKDIVNDKLTTSRST